MISKVITEAVKMSLDTQNNSSNRKLTRQKKTNVLIESRNRYTSEISVVRFKTLDLIETRDSNRKRIDKDGICVEKIIWKA